MDVQTEQRILLPALLFMLLSPGVLLQLPDRIPFVAKGAFMSQRTSMLAVVVHALVFAAAYFFVRAKMTGYKEFDHDIILATVLFVVLSPGALMQFPGVGIKPMSYHTSYPSVAVHAFVFAASLFAVHKFLPKY